VPDRSTGDEHARPAPLDRVRVAPNILDQPDQPIDRDDDATADASR